MNSPSKPAARAAYQRYFPHYPLAASNSNNPDNADLPIYQAFTMGRVRILLTDSRSEADPINVPSFSFSFSFSFFSLSLSLQTITSDSLTLIMKLRRMSFDVSVYRKCCGVRIK
jgi:hypothetical protein